MQREFGVYRSGKIVWCLQEWKRCLVFTGTETMFGVYRNGMGVWCLQEWEGCFIGWDSLKNMKCSARGPGNVTNTTCLCTGDAKIDDLYEECSTPRHASYFVFQ